MAEVRISAEPRTEFGKGGARRTRRAGKLPAVIYGHGSAPRHISLPARDFSTALRGAGSNVLLRVDLDGNSELALPKAIQRDPVRGQIEHVDLLLVRRGEKVRVDVPVLLVGEPVAGALVDHSMTTLPVTAEATHIPSNVEVSIAGLAVGESVHAADVKLPGDVELNVDPDAVVVHVLAAPTVEQIEAELAGAEAELGAGAAGAAAAQPASEGAAGAAGAGDVVPDTASGEGGPAAGQTPQG